MKMRNIIGRAGGGTKDQRQGRINILITAITIPVTGTSPVITTALITRRVITILTAMLMVLGTVSYTHLDVYKRQEENKGI